MTDARIYADAVLDAIHQLSIGWLDASTKWQIADYAELDPWQVQLGLDTASEQELTDTLCTEGPQA